MAVVFPNNNLPTAAQPWAREITKQLSSLITSTKTSEINNVARDAQLGSSISAINTALARLGIFDSLYFENTNEIDGAKIRAGTVTATQLAGTITGTILQTAASGRRVVIGGTAATFYDTTGGYSGSITVTSGGMSSQLELLSPFAGISITMNNSGVAVNGLTTIDSGIKSANVATESLSGTTLDVFVAAADGRLGIVTSSRDTKQDIKPLELSVDAVLAVEPKSFKYNVDVDAMGNDAPETVGFIAEELDDLGLTQFVNYINGKPHSISYSKFVVALLAVVRQLNDRIETLEKGA